MLKQKDKIDTPDMALSILDSIYSKAINGIGVVSPSVETMGMDYLCDNTIPELAAKAMIKSQIVKCATSGFLTGFGGVLTMPVTVPLNVGNVLYVQMRMIACTAYLAGLDIHSDQVQTLIYACLAGVTVNQVIKKTSAKVGERVTMNMIKKIPGETLTKINQRVGFKFVTKFGQKGAVNLGKLVPVAGAVISGTFDFAETKVIADRAYSVFFGKDGGSYAA